ncbi:CCA tRNA nucleotidyltransferase [Paremcibacter congregatus]|uniref:CCA tRNA nucleotidyltransferase n=1 Tax=Paremcibacter congregatus TaxID=2043170 RepID=UPI0030EEE917|tara:strand:+ start:404 stop:1612 length:1209 start_codon:yes stop_codon:yes gene_type:complete
MKAVRQLDLPADSPICAPGVQKLLSVLNVDGLNARMVGGCVRDLLLQRKIIDIDLACCLPPEQTMLRLKRAKIKVVPTGLKHGTITAVLDKVGYEVTTLRHDVETDGRHATVAFTDDWIGDAARRDFTFNALYLDADGSLYDPCGGLADLETRRVRFIGAADERIREDALRILRFFRFAAQIGDGLMDPQGFAACIRYKDLIDNLSGERLAQELLKILAAQNLLSVIAVMAKHDFLSHILGVTPDWPRFRRYVQQEQNLGRCDRLARLCSLLRRGEGAGAQVSRHLKLSNRQSKYLVAYDRHDLNISPGMADKTLRRAIYLHGRDVVAFALLDGNSEASPTTQLSELLHLIDTWPVPSFPVQGRDLVQAGYAAGPALGDLLKQREADWIASDFTLKKQDLLQ